MAKYQLESGLVHALKMDRLDLLRCHGVLEYRFIHVPTGRNPVERQHAGDMAGIEDLQVYIARGVTLRFELKSSTGKQMAHQSDWEQQLRKLGHYYYCINDTDQFDRVMLDHGIDVSKYSWSNLPHI